MHNNHLMQHKILPGKLDDHKNIIDFSLRKFQDHCFAFQLFPTLHELQIALREEE